MHIAHALSFRMSTHVEHVIQLAGAAQRFSGPDHDLAIFVRLQRFPLRTRLVVPLVLVTDSDEASQQAWYLWSNNESIVKNATVIFREQLLYITHSYLLKVM